MTVVVEQDAEVELLLAGVRLDQRPQRLVGRLHAGDGLAHPAAALAHLGDPARHPVQVGVDREPPLHDRAHQRRAPGRGAVVVPHRGQTLQQAGQARVVAGLRRVVRGGDIGEIGARGRCGRRGGLGGASPGPLPCRSRAGPLHFEQRISHAEAARLGHEAEHLLAVGQRPRAQEVGQHHEQAGRAGVASRGQVVPPARGLYGQLGLAHQVVHHRPETLGRVVAQEVVHAPRVHQAGAHQAGVLVDRDVEQVGQQPDVLPQRERAVGLGGAAAVVVEIAALSVGVEAQLHAHRVVARERLQVHPLQAQPRLCRVERVAPRQQQRAGAVGQHPAQEVGVEVGLVAARREAGGLEHARRQVAAHRQRAPCVAVLHLAGGERQRAQAGGAHADAGVGVHGRRAQLALHHVGEARHDRVAAAGAAGQQVHRVEAAAGVGQRRAHRGGGHLRVAFERAAIRPDRVVAARDAVLGEDALLDAARRAVDRRHVGVHAVVVDRLARQVKTGAGDEDVVVEGGHASVRVRRRAPQRS